MEVRTATEIGSRLRECSTDLERARYRRDILKRLLAIARRDKMAGWEAHFLSQLKVTRKTIQRLSAKQSYLARRLAGRHERRPGGALANNGITKGTDNGTTQQDTPRG